MASTRRAYTPDEVAKMAERLRSLSKTPPSKPLTKASAIRMLAGEIQKMRRGGYTLSQIAEVLKSEGLDINKQVLRNYLHKQAKPNAQPRGKPQVSPQTTPPETEPEKAQDTGPEFKCPKCGRLLKRREGQYGPWWACTGYPDCKFKTNDNNGRPVALHS